MLGRICKHSSCTSRHLEAPEALAVELTRPRWMLGASTGWTSHLRYLNIEFRNRLCSVPTYTREPEVDSASPTEGQRQGQVPLSTLALCAQSLCPHPHATSRCCRNDRIQDGNHLTSTCQMLPASLACYLVNIPSYKGPRPLGQRGLLDGPTGTCRARSSPQSLSIQTFLHVQNTDPQG